MYTFTSINEIKRNADWNYESTCPSSSFQNSYKSIGKTIQKTD